MIHVFKLWLCELFTKNIPLPHKKQRTAHMVITSHEVIYKHVTFPFIHIWPCCRMPAKMITYSASFASAHTRCTVYKRVLIDTYIRAVEDMNAKFTIHKYITGTNS